MIVWIEIDSVQPNQCPELECRKLHLENESIFLNKEIRSGLSENRYSLLNGLQVSLNDGSEPTSIAGIKNKYPYWVSMCNTILARNTE